MLFERRFDFRQLDAEATDVDAPVGTAGPLDIAVGPIAGEFAGTIEPVTSVTGEWTSDKHRGAALVVVQIAQGQMRAAHIEFTQLTDAAKSPALV